MRIPVAVFGWVEVPESADEEEITRTCEWALAAGGAGLEVVGWEVVREEAVSGPSEGP